MSSKLIITHLNHDLQGRKSYVNLVWSDDPNKRLGLEVPFQTDMNDVESAARAALSSLSDELNACELLNPIADD